MDVLVWSSAVSRARAQAHGFGVASDQGALFARGDVVSVHLRLVPQTRGVIGREDLLLMKADATFINTSRAGLVAPGALVEALRAGRPGAAAVDVFEREPMLDAADPLLAMDNVICTPHIGYVTREEFEIQFAEIFDQILAYAAGSPINVVNADVLERR